MNIDTLSIARDLKATELPAAQAEAIAAATGRSVTGGSATKSDLQLVLAGLEAKIEQLRTEIERSRNRVVIGFVSTQIALASLIIAAIKFL